MRSNKIGKKAVICLREPSLGPVFGMKGGAAGGGMAQVVPMEDINLHFTGDFGAIGLAHNLLSALIDNHVHHGNELGFDVRRIAWKRVMDMNDRALRDITVGLGGPGNGFPRQDGFDIVVASEVMAIFCLARNLADLKQRLGNIVVGYRRDLSPIRARDLNAQGAMTVLLKEALKPNLVQTLENNPAFIHGGPFANIAHGCNSVLATTTALKLADYVVTEAGFGADLGAEKFIDIKCRKSGLRPSAVVLVATIRALKYHGGADLKQINTENLGRPREGHREPRASREQRAQSLRAALRRVGESLHRGHRRGARAAREDDEEAGRAAGARAPLGRGRRRRCRRRAQGGGDRRIRASRSSASSTTRSRRSGTRSRPSRRRSTAPPTSRRMRRSSGQIEKLQTDGYGHYPVCIAKTQYSFSTDPAARGAPSGHTLNVREVRLAAGAEFIVVVCGDVMTMPGLPKVPSADKIDIDAEGRVVGLF